MEGFNPRPPEGFTLGRDGSGEPERIEVCPHDQPLGWSCVGCAKARKPPQSGTVPANRAKPPRFVLRAICNHCGQRSWLPEVTP